eukprot:5523183-Pyramimonas_sp.AAC.1
MPEQTAGGAGGAERCGASDPVTASRLYRRRPANVLPVLTLPAFDWSNVRIYPRVLPLIGHQEFSLSDCSTRRSLNPLCLP